MSQVGSPNRNGRTYPVDVVQAALAKFTTEPRVGYLGVNHAVAKIDPAFIVRNARLVGDAVVADVELLATTAGTKLREMLDMEVPLAFRTCGTGKLDGANVVTEFELESVAVEPQLGFSGSAALVGHRPPRS